LTRLWLDQEGICYWCEEETQLVSLRNSKSAGWFPRMATKDHLYHRKDPVRKATSDQNLYIVMACASCNMVRGREDDRWWQQRKRAVSGP